MNKEDYLRVISDPDFKIFGMKKNELLEMRRQYLLRGGPVKITVESIKKVFG